MPALSLSRILRPKFSQKVSKEEEPPSDLISHVFIGLGSYIWYPLESGYFIIFITFKLQKYSKCNRTPNLWEEWEIPAYAKTDSCWSCFWKSWRSHALSSWSISPSIWSNTPSLGRLPVLKCTLVYLMCTPVYSMCAPVYCWSARQYTLCAPQVIEGWKILDHLLLDRICPSSYYSWNT